MTQMAATAADVLCAMETLPNDAVAALVNALDHLQVHNSWQS